MDAGTATKRDLYDHRRAAEDTHVCSIEVVEKMSGDDPEFAPSPVG
jgi:hypothetical protein